MRGERGEARGKKQVARGKRKTVRDERREVTMGERGGTWAPQSSAPSILLTYACTQNALCTKDAHKMHAIRRQESRQSPAISRGVATCTTYRVRNSVRRMLLSVRKRTEEIDARYKKPPSQWIPGTCIGCLPGHCWKHIHLLPTKHKIGWARIQWESEPGTFCTCGCEHRRAWRNM